MSDDEERLKFSQIKETYERLWQSFKEMMEEKKNDR